MVDEPFACGMAKFSIEEKPHTIARLAGNPEV